MGQQMEIPGESSGSVHGGRALRWVGRGNSGWLAGVYSPPTTQALVGQLSSRQPVVGRRREGFLLVSLLLLLQTAQQHW